MYKRCLRYIPFSLPPLIYIILPDILPQVDFLHFSSDFPFCLMFCFWLLDSCSWRLFDHCWLDGSQPYHKNCSCRPLSKSLFLGKIIEVFFISRNEEIKRLTKREREINSKERRQERKTARKKERKKGRKEKRKKEMVFNVLIHNYLFLNIKQFFHQYCFKKTYPLILLFGFFVDKQCFQHSLIFLVPLLSSNLIWSFYLLKNVSIEMQKV